MDKARWIKWSKMSWGINIWCFLLKSWWFFQEVPEMNNGIIFKFQLPKQESPGMVQLCWQRQWEGKILLMETVKLHGYRWFQVLSKLILSCLIFFNIFCPDNKRVQLLITILISFPFSYIYLPNWNPLLFLYLVSNTSFVP